MDRGFDDRKRELFARMRRAEAALTRARETGANEDRMRDLRLALRLARNAASGDGSGLNLEETT